VLELCTELLTPSNGISTACQRVINGIKVFSKGYDSSIADALQREHGAVAGDDKIGVCGKGAFEDAVIGLVS